MNFSPNLFSKFDLTNGTIQGAPIISRHLSDLRESFADKYAFEEAFNKEDSIIYTVSSIQPADGDGQLHYGLGLVMPGKINSEYFLTKGHLHQRRSAAEVYIGLRGKGMMLLEHEQSGEASMVELSANTVVYVPGFTAHRTVNVGNEPLVYVGVYPADAGHDYTSIAENNFRHVIVDRNGTPTLMTRKEFLTTTLK